MQSQQKGLKQEKKKKPAVSRTDAVQLGTAQFVPTWCFMMIH